MPTYENFEKASFESCGRYGIPVIYPETEYPRGEFIPINYHYTAKEQADKIVHFFVDDSLFVRHWNCPERYLPNLKKFRALLSPDFSTYTNMPFAVQIFNHYRKHWLAAYWQQNGITVYPTISWSTPGSYEWCFDGEPTNSIVAVSSVGCARDKDAKRLFLRGYDEMMKRLSPTWVIWYGKVFEECDWNLIKVKPFGATFTERGRGKVVREYAALSVRPGNA